MVADAFLAEVPTPRSVSIRRAATYRQRRHPSHRDAIARLCGAVLAEQTDQWTERDRYLSLEVLQCCQQDPAPDLTAIEPVQQLQQMSIIKVSGVRQSWCVVRGLLGV